MTLEIYPDRIIVGRFVIGRGWYSYDPSITSVKKGYILFVHSKKYSLHKIETFFPPFIVKHNMLHILIDHNGNYVPFWNINYKTRNFQTYNGQFTINDVKKQAPNFPRVLTRAKIDGKPVFIHAKNPNEIYIIATTEDGIYEKKVTTGDILPYITDKELEIDENWQKVVDESALPFLTFDDSKLTTKVYVFNNKFEYTEFKTKFLFYKNVPAMVWEDFSTEIISSFGGDIIRTIQKLVQNAPIFGPNIAVFGNRILTRRGEIVVKSDYIALDDVQKEAAKYILGVKTWFRTTKYVKLVIRECYTSLYFEDRKVYTKRIGKAYLWGKSTGEYHWYNVMFTNGKCHRLSPAGPRFSVYRPLPPKVMKKLAGGKRICLSDVLPGFSGPSDGCWIIRGKSKIFPCVQFHDDGTIETIVPYVDGAYKLLIPPDNTVDVWTVESVEEVPEEYVQKQVYSYCIRGANVYAVQEHELLISKGDKSITFTEHGYIIISDSVKSEMKKQKFVEPLLNSSLDFDTFWLALNM